MQQHQASAQAGSKECCPSSQPDLLPGFHLFAEASASSFSAQGSKSAQLLRHARRPTPFGFISLLKHQQRAFLPKEASPHSCCVTHADLLPGFHLFAEASAASFSAQGSKSTQLLRHARRPTPWVSSLC
ncbi:hypothetical protein QOT17_024799 [Balamuthia mandrillaris]